MSRGPILLKELKFAATKKAKETGALPSEQQIAVERRAKELRDEAEELLNIADGIELDFWLGQAR
jgi:hypothetical protein